MVGSDWDTFGPIHAKGFRPFAQAIEDDAYLVENLGTGFNYHWVDRCGNSVAFGYDLSEVKRRKEERNKPKEVKIPKGFRGYKEEKKFYGSKRNRR